MNHRPHLCALRRALLSAALFLLLLAGTASAQSRISLDLGLDFTSGDYGTEVTSDAATISVLLGYTPTDRLDLFLSIPWISQSSSATTTSGGIRFGVRGRNSAESPPMLRGPMGGPAPGEVEERRSGLGDITLSAGYTLARESERTPLVRPTAFVKFPTAESGLGTGEFDVGAGAELSKWFESWYLFGRGSLVLQGGRDDLELKDFATYEVGGGTLLADRLLPTLSLWGATEPAEGASSQMEARLSLSYRLSAAKGFSASALLGLADASPDYGFGGTFYVTF